MYVHKSYLMFEQFAIEIIIFYFRKYKLLLFSIVIVIVWYCFQTTLTTPNQTKTPK